MKSVLKTIRLNVKVADAVQELAHKENRNYNNMVETLLIRAIEQQKKK